MGGGLLGAAFGHKSLDEVAFKGDLGKLRKMLAKGASVDRPSSDPKLAGRAPLHAAAIAGQADTVEALINAGATIDIRDVYGRTPLHYAVQAGQTRVVDVLLNCGADYTLRDSAGQMAIHVAAAAGRGEARERLVAQALEHSCEFAFFDSGHWCPFDEGAGRLLGFELAEGVPFSALALAHGANYIVDFQQQIQINVLSLFMKSVSWRVLPNGQWNRPAHPCQGLHPGSQDPRLLQRYDSLFRSLQSQGVEVCPIYVSLQGALQRGPPMQPSAPAMSPQVSALPSPLPAAAAGGGYWGAPHSTAGASGVVSWDVPYSDVSEPSTPLARNRPTPLADGMEGLALNERSRSGSRSSYGEGDGDDEDGRWPENPLCRILRSGSEDYQEVCARFLRGMERPGRSIRPGGPAASTWRGGGGNDSGREDEAFRPVTVVGVQAVLLTRQRQDSFDRACASLAQARGNPNVQWAWHGAPKGALERIIDGGFTLPSHSRNGRLYGDGVYLSPSDKAHTSAEFALPDSSGVKHMLLCRVALGSVERIPFESSQRRPSSMRFDTGVDNLENPSRFVVWEEDMNDIILPTHILSFRYC